MATFKRRSLLVGAGAVAGAAGVNYFLGEKLDPGRSWPPVLDAADGDIVNDASLLSPTRVAKHIMIGDNPREKLIEQLRSELKAAKTEGRPVCAAAARHTMGGQAMAKDGTAFTMNQSWLEPDTSNSTFLASAGTRWSHVIAELDQYEMSPKVMQSNHDFGVASTFCVNAHGWPVPYSGFGSTVRSIDLMLADGEVVKCSRQKNTDLFNLAMGGYGLSGIIVEIEAEAVENLRLVPTFETMPGAEFGERFVAALKSDPSINMAYGRLDVTLDRFFDEALMITYRPTENQSDLPSASGSGFLSKAARHVYRAQVDSDRMKRIRWFMETGIGPTTGGGEVTRNSLINEPVATLDDRDPDRTDILHEYFVQPERFGEFIEACRVVIPSSYQQLLNITLRYVAVDDESVLSYATTPRIATVMSFSQEMTVRAEADMQRMTSALIGRILDINGAYYLPYRLHATDKQFQRCYRRAEDFVAQKRAVDPDLLFTNAMWDRYMAKL